MNPYPFQRTNWLAALAITSLQTLMLFGATSIAEEVKVEDGWTISRPDSDGEHRTFDLTLHPQPEPAPALKHRLIPDRYEQQDGNAAIYYLKALGFFEETAAQQAIFQFENESSEAAKKQGLDDYAPYSWLKMEPKQLPLKEAKKYSSFLSFQPPLLQAATRQRHFSLERSLKDEESPLTVLLPEIQRMRQLARYQSLRTRIALAEDRVDDAIEIIGQQFALAHHLGSDELFVPNLVGAAIAGMAWDDMMYLLSNPQTPNLYWAFASLPRPLIDMKKAAGFERQFLFEQVKCLREVTDQVRPEGYWQDFLDRFEKQLHPILQFEGGVTLGASAADQRIATVSVLAAAYPGAKRFLLEHGMNEKQVEEYPRVQAVLLAVRRYYEHARDAQFKWDFLPYVTAKKSKDFQSLSDRVAADGEKYGWITEPANLLLPALLAIRTAQQRIEQRIAMAQTVEAIRMYADENDRRLPNSLEDLRLPAPLDPLTGETFAYKIDGERATLTGAKAAYQTIQLNLSIAK